MLLSEALIRFFSPHVLSMIHHFYNVAFTSENYRFHLSLFLCDDVSPFAKNKTTKKYPRGLITDRHTDYFFDHRPSNSTKRVFYLGNVDIDVHDVLIKEINQQHKGIVMIAEEYKSLFIYNYQHFTMIEKFPINHIPIVSPGFAPIPFFIISG